MKKLIDLNYEERKEFAELLHIWLKDYSEEVVNKAALSFEEIYNNKFAMNLLKELKLREYAEFRNEQRDFEWLLRDVAENTEELAFVRLNIATHSKSYRDILYDLYLKYL